MAENDDAGNAAKQRWLEAAEQEAKEEEKNQKEGNSLFNAALARSKRAKY